MHPRCVRRVAYVPGDYHLARLLQEAADSPDFPREIRDRMMSRVRNPQWIQYAREMIGRVGGCAPVLVRLIRDRSWGIIELTFVGRRWRKKVLMDRAARNLFVPPSIRRVVFRGNRKTFRRYFIRVLGVDPGETEPVFWAFLALAASWRGMASEQEFLEQLVRLRQDLPGWVDAARQAGVEESLEIVGRIVFGISLSEEVQNACGHRVRH